MRRTLQIAAALLIVAAGAHGFRLLDVAARVGAGFAAHVTCALVFHSGMDPDRVMRDYVAHQLGPASPLISVEVDRTARTVRGLAAMAWDARAVFRDGVGCTLLPGGGDLMPAAWTDPPHPPALPTGVPWPHGSARVEVPAPPELVRAIDDAFSEPEGRAGRMRQTLAVLVAHRGRLIAERYAPGFEATTPLLSWSMAKSVTAALIGIGVRDGWIDLRAPAPVAEWRGGDDPRSTITTDQLLRMSSGLRFDETYGAVNDVSRMLFTQRDTGSFAAAFPSQHAPGSMWSYSSGTSNILARVLRDHFGGDLAALTSWSREQLLDPLGLRTAVLEADASGSFIGSSFVFASGRDWARFGQLHLQDGRWRGARILPEGWVQYVSQPTPHAPEGRYGAGFWLNAGDPDDLAQRMWPELPRDAYAARGMSGQYVVIVPSADLVVVRLGLSQAEGDALHGIEPLVGAAIATLASADD